MSTAAPMKASELLERLQRHYIKPGELMPGGAFLPEVVLGSRRADALYVGFFQSRGKMLVGHELKVSRADWLHELDQPAKAEAWEPNCHSWYVVAPSTDIVRPEELPHGWGLMIPGRSRTRMTVVVKATVHPDRNPSWEATHALVQKMDSLRIRAIEKDREATHTKLCADIEEKVERRVALATGDHQLQSEVEHLRKTIDELRDILGLKVVDHAWKDHHVTVAEIRTSFATWLAADKDVQRALGRRFFDLSHAQRTIADAVTALETVRGAA
ncbi:hypothetical protein [Microbacterium sp. p3-SID131]|uniref:hypothetical protein n=1 Tax=Microbacterium sp. p3-SID131 TaxID=2916215 RepID=UPI0021A805E1|nr:hypothetical protein [Microbacterium sp. p3-SID131]MCT1363940.1 hypothetical protein [Microbacterium sp. p3-SID131]